MLRAEGRLAPLETLLARLVRIGRVGERAKDDLALGRLLPGGLGGLGGEHRRGDEDADEADQSDHVDESTRPRYDRHIVRQADSKLRANAGAFIRDEDRIRSRSSRRLGRLLAS